jgi:ATPase subunit of ABC transporter with duplicated ATPase domains
VALCRLLLEAPGVLLLDEPTNHLDATSVAWLERYLGAYRGTVLAVTHDRYFLDNVAGWILEVDGGRAMPYAGNYSVWLERKAARGEGEARADRKKGKAMEEELVVYEDLNALRHKAAQQRSDALAAKADAEGKIGALKARAAQAKKNHDDLKDKLAKDDVATALDDGSKWTSRGAESLVSKPVLPLELCDALRDSSHVTTVDVAEAEAAAVTQVPPPYPSKRRTSGIRRLDLAAVLAAVAVSPTRARR